MFNYWLVPTTPQLLVIVVLAVAVFAAIEFAKDDIKRWRR